MLHMLIAEHGADSCPASHQDVREKYLPHMGRRDEVTKKLGVTIQGGWTDMPGHLIYMLVDAPNAHAVTEMAIELHLMDWNTVVVRPVITMEQATEKAASRKL
ncbi:MAG: DUF3303 family protein [Dehalococcoidia bacterium]